MLAAWQELLLDMLVHPEGFRLRDRVSHGEVSPATSKEFWKLVVVCRWRFSA